MFSFPAMNSIDVVFDSNMMEWRQVKFPKTKKKRIQKKWRKNPRYWAYAPMLTAMKLGNSLVMHPAVWEALKERIRVQVPGEAR